MRRRLARRPTGGGNRAMLGACANRRCGELRGSSGPSSARAKALAPYAAPRRQDGRSPWTQASEAMNAAPRATRPAGMSCATSGRESELRAREDTRAERKVRTRLPWSQLRLQRPRQQLGDDMVHQIGVAEMGGDNRAVLGALAPIEGAASSSGVPPSGATARASGAAARTPSSAGAEAHLGADVGQMDDRLGADVGQTVDADWARASRAVNAAPVEHEAGEFLSTPLRQDCRRERRKPARWQRGRGWLRARRETN
jgi:hypothetical protein